MGVADGGVKEDVSMRVGEGIRTFGAMKRGWRARSATLNVKRELYEKTVVLTVIYVSESWGMRVEERKKLDVAEFRRNEVSSKYVWGYNVG